MRAIIATTECVPFTDSSPMAELAGAMVRLLPQFDIEVKVFMPLYGTIDNKKYGIEKIERIPPLRVPMLGGTKIGELFLTRYPGTESEVCFIKGPQYFDRNGLDTDPLTGIKFSDNGDRYAFLGKAVLISLFNVNFQPHLIHCLDYYTGLIPAYLRLTYHEDSFYNNIACLFTFHSLVEQGEFSPRLLDTMGMGKDQFFPGGSFERDGKINFTKIGIEYSDIVSNLSQTYALEVMEDPTYSQGLENSLKMVSNRFFGIPSGIDELKWDPQTDSALPFNYSAQDPFGKKLCKGELLEKIGFSRDEALVPIICYCGEMVTYQGAELFLEIIPKLLKKDLKILIIEEKSALSNPEIEAFYAILARKYPQKTVFLKEPEEPLLHLALAGSDIAVFPWLFAPSGIQQLYCIRYGTVPIARKTGSLADAIIDYNEDPQNGFGFTFPKFSALDLFDSIEIALKTYYQPQVWDTLVKRGMAQDFSW
ncbi:glycogen synthase, partial [bacterium]|nr:glycogen synthase [bacterium]